MTQLCLLTFWWNGARYSEIGKPFTLREALFQSVMSQLKFVFYKKVLILEIGLCRRGVFRLFRLDYDVEEHARFMTDLFILIEYLRQCGGAQ